MDLDAAGRCGEAAHDTASQADNTADAAGRCGEAAHDTASQADNTADTASQADNTADTAMPDSPAAPFPWHNLTTNDLSQLLRVLSDTSSLDESPEDLETVGLILKKFGYRSFWNALSAVDSLSLEDRDRMWSNLDAESCTRDLNDVVAMVNARLKVDPDAEFGPCRRIEKIYFPRPSLSDKNKERITRTINDKYLAVEVLDSPSRVIVVESCTRTGKTTAVIALARRLAMPVISVCERISQVQHHVQAFRKAGIPTVQYDEADVSRFRQGSPSYILLLDITGHILFSHTLRSTRKAALFTLGWLAAEKKKCC